MRVWRLRAVVVVTVLVGTLVSAVPVGAVVGSVVINEIMYHPAVDNDATDIDDFEYLELHNPGDTDVSLLGMSFTAGIEGTFGPVTLAAGGYLIVSPDASTTQAEYGITPELVYTSKLANGGETVTLTAADGTTVVDTVSYDDEGGWPLSPDGDGPSLELTDPTANNDTPVSWAASTTPTPGAQNSTFGGGGGPGFGGVSVVPAWPNSGEPVAISVEIAGATSADLIYRVMFGSTVTVPMTQSGSTFSATVPGQDAGELVRYRIETDSGATLPTADDSITELGFVVRKSVTTDLETIEWFIEDDDLEGLLSEESRLGEDIFFPAVIAYEGVVHTGVQVKIRGGQYARMNNAKQGLSVEFPSGHDFVAPEIFDYPVDEFALKYDISVARIPVSWWVFEQAGFPHYNTQNVRVQKNGEFYAQYRLKEKLDGTWRQEQGIDTGQFFKAEGGFKYGGWDKKNPDDGDFSAILAMEDLISPSVTQAELWEAWDIPNVVNYMATSAIIRHQDQDHHNKYVYFDEADTQQWRYYPWDLDHTFGTNGNSPCENEDMVTLSCLNNGAFNAFWRFGDFQDMYFRRIRSLLDGPMTAPQIENLNAEVRALLVAEADEEEAAWGENPLDGSDNSFLFEVQDRRDVFEADSRVPDSQPQTPEIVINELQYNPLDGQPEFLELHNPGNEWIDLSLWELDAVGLTIPGGTVIEPGGYVVFADDLRLFWDTHNPGDGYLVIQYPKGLSGGGELVELRKPDGTLIDSVEYDDKAPWPTLPDDGVFSLELAEPDLDNAVAPSWHASTIEGGTPGSSNSDGQDPGMSGPITWPATVVDAGSPQSVGGTVSPDVARVDVIAVDLGAAGASGIPLTQLSWWDGTGWGSARTTLPAAIEDGTWNFSWDPVPGGSGSYAIGITAFDAAGDKIFPLDKDLQAIVVISDLNKPAISVEEPAVSGNTITWSGAAAHPASVRKVRLIIRHVDSNEYWNGTTWVGGAAAASALLTAELSEPLGTSPDWSYQLTTTRTGEFQTLHWAQSGAYVYSTGTAATVTKDQIPE